METNTPKNEKTSNRPNNEKTHNTPNWFSVTSYRNLAVQGLASCKVEPYPGLTCEVKFYSGTKTVTFF